MRNRWEKNGHSAWLYFLELQNHQGLRLHSWNLKTLAPRKKTIPNLDSVSGSRDITLLTKVPILKVTVFLVVTYRCQSWTIEKAEHWRTDAFERWCWRRHTRAPWTARRSNQSLLKETNSEYSLEGLILKPKIQYFGLLMWSTNSLENTLMLGNIEGRRGRGRQRMKWLDENIQPSLSQWTWVWANSGR